jgi:Predicted permeases
MAISLSLIQSIVVMFIMILTGFTLAKCKIIHVQDADVLSKLVLYIACPASIISSFQIQLTSENFKGFCVSLAGGVILHAAFIFLTWLLSKKIHFSSIEKVSMIYPNAGNLIIPLVSMTLGKEMVIYCSGCLIVTTILLWTHCRSVVSGQKMNGWKKILCNINILSILLGTVLFLANIQLPSILKTSMDSMSAILAPLSMFVIGIILSSANMKDIFLNKRAYVICFFRLIVYPLILMGILILTGMTQITKNASTILMITMLVGSAPSASTVAQFASLYHNDAKQASIINVMSIMLCIVTIPIINAIYILFTTN